MAAYINYGFDLTDESIIIPLNRWGRCCYTLQVQTGLGDVVLGGTLTQVNRRDRDTGIAPTPIFATLDDDAGAPISGFGIGIVRVNGYALEAVEITAIGTVTGIFMQQGEND